MPHRIVWGLSFTFVPPSDLHLHLPGQRAREGEGDEPLSCCRLTETGGGSSPFPSHRRGDGSPPLPEGRGENTCCRHMRLPSPPEEEAAWGAARRASRIMRSNLLVFASTSLFQKQMTR